MHPCRPGRTARPTRAASRRTRLGPVSYVNPFWLALSWLPFGWISNVELLGNVFFSTKQQASSMWVQALTVRCCCSSSAEWNMANHGHGHRSGGLQSRGFARVSRWQMLKVGSCAVDVHGQVAAFCALWCGVEGLDAPCSA